MRKRQTRTGNSPLGCRGSALKGAELKRGAGHPRETSAGTAAESAVAIVADESGSVTSEASAFVPRRRCPGQAWEPCARWSTLARDASPAVGVSVAGALRVTPISNTAFERTPSCGLARFAVGSGGGAAQRERYKS
jgi:hypothetical protein